jgi:hypothetical protein
MHHAADVLLVPLARSRARGLPAPRQGEGRAELRPWRGALHGTSCWFGALRAHVPRGKGASAHPGSYLWRAALVESRRAMLLTALALAHLVRVQAAPALRMERSAGPGLAQAGLVARSAAAQAS